MPIILAALLVVLIAVYVEQAAPDSVGFVNLLEGAVGMKVAGYVKGVASDIVVYPIGEGHYLREDAARAFLSLKAWADAQKVPLIVTSAWRSMEQQTSLWGDFLAGRIATPVAEPGNSNHQSGVALDIQVGASNSSPTYLWLAQNAPDYGFMNVGASFSKPEFWHWEYIGYG